MDDNYLNKIDKILYGKDSGDMFIKILASAIDLLEDEVQRMRNEYIDDGKLPDVTNQTILRVKDALRDLLFSLQDRDSSEKPYLGKLSSTYKMLEKYRQEIDGDKESKLEHDTFCKKMMEEPEVLSYFVKLALGDKNYMLVDQNSIRLIQGQELITGTLKTYHSDIIIRFNLKKNFEELLDPKKRLEVEKLKKKYKTDDLSLSQIDILILAEHKSYFDRFVLFQLLRYLVIFWGNEYDSGVSNLRYVFPVLITHGNSIWDKDNTFGMCMHPIMRLIFGEPLIGVNPRVIDLSKIDIESIKGCPKFKLFALILGNSHGDLRKAFEDSLDILGEETGNDDNFTITFGKVLENIFSYISGSGSITLKDIDNLEKKVREKYKNKNLGDTIMTLGQALEERGEKRGISIGEKKGEERGIISVAKRLKDLGSDIDYISKATGLSEEEVEKL